MNKPVAVNNPLQADPRLTRIAIVDEAKCKPSKCNFECKNNCPVVKMGKLCIEVNRTSNVAKISEVLCNGCGICVKKCPFKAIKIINLPKELEKDTTHRYHANSFKLHRLPQPRQGSVLGLVGQNGIGKSTALKILSGSIKPNLGDFKNPPDWSTIAHQFRGSSLQNYFNKLVEGKIKTVVKPQHVYGLAKVAVGKTVGEVLIEKNERNIMDDVIKALDLENIMSNKIETLSGGELQRFAIGAVIMQQADMYIFDEFTSFLDIQQRLNAAKLIRSLIIDDPDKYVIVVEHDLSILDFTSDYISMLYGTPGVYGVITHPSGVLEGINTFLDGYLHSENLRFRPESLSFKTSNDQETDEIVAKQHRNYRYPDMEKVLGNFHLKVKGGEFSDSEIVVLLGQNGTGKTTFIKLLAGKINSDNSEKMDPMSVSYKPQEVSFKVDWTVMQLFHKKIPASYCDPVFQSDVIKPMKIDNILDQSLSDLSGGELQRVAIILTLGVEADLYLIDEPSAMLDAEQRLVVAKVIKRFILHSKKTAFIVEHDFIMATYMASRVVVYDGIPAKHATAHAPEGLVSGMNKFLAKLDVTFRRDSKNYRPRVNKLNGQLDREQKRSGNYFLMDL